jgi:OOP family OmpA-OmpF porin
LIAGDAEHTVSDVAKTLLEDPSLKMRLKGYTDNVGSRDANQTLSEKRANSVVDWLAAHGVDRSRLRATAKRLAFL